MVTQWDAVFEEYLFLAMCFLLSVVAQK